MAQLEAPSHPPYSTEKPATAGSSRSLLTTCTLLMAYAALIAGIYWNAGWWEAW